MNVLETRIAALEQDMLVLVAAIQQVAVTQTLFASIAGTQLTTIAEQLKRMRDDLDGDGDEWKRT